ncbi:hypothetical protein BN59_01305 [Legionella massiliensis]|uniref:Uncharacterized protein n=1 Tax=Legionella massiliensis TaxID=1034943 RepID=A0A078KVL4_9GAMM|nr:hypothetical protein [Legionella massiliensis]CDZ77026.1 hypothetical protein BN59_01305 [Legionella massiliensis]CEE12764.1 hypothetical protein BN1094_01305 [Legionella massiliensis]
MDLKTLAGQSPQILAVVEAIRSDPSFLNELKTNPQEALSKKGLQLDEEELGIVQKLGEFEAEAENIFNKVKGLFGFNDKEGN